MIRDRALGKVEKVLFCDHSIVFEAKRKRMNYDISILPTLIRLKVTFGMIFLVKGEISKKIREIEV